MKIALIDADIVTFRNAASCETKDKDTGEYIVKDSLDIAFARMDKMMHDLLIEVGAKEYKAFISGENNFRYTINPQYKANRPAYRPQYLQACREHLVLEWGARVTDGYEADDAVGMEQTEHTILCSNDKDLNMIPGEHYNFIKKENFYVTELAGLQAFYRQMLVGDTVDNIVGISGIGPVKAAKAIDHIQTEVEMFQTVCNLYEKEAFEYEKRFWMNADCLWIWQTFGETFSQRYDRRNSVQ